MLEYTPYESGIISACGCGRQDQSTNSITTTKTKTVTQTSSEIQQGLVHTRVWQICVYLSSKQTTKATSSSLFTSYHWKNI